MAPFVPFQHTSQGTLAQYAYLPSEYDSWFDYSYKKGYLHLKIHNSEPHCSKVNLLEIHKPRLDHEPSLRSI